MIARWCVLLTALALSPDSMVRVPGGAFVMGESGYATPTTRVTLRPYWLDRMEVSVADYVACVEARWCRADHVDACGPESNWKRPGFERHPMNCVSWDEAQDYCAFRGKRLPTEAEWEFAARGTDGRMYPWGNERPDDSKADYFHMIIGPRHPDGTTAKSEDEMRSKLVRQPGTVPVDSYANVPSPFGALNLAGNVCEWVYDWFAPYPGGSVTDSARSERRR